jgi:hypothetical protein
MSHVRQVCIVCAAIISTMLAAPAVAGENNFVFVPQADFLGNDLLKVDNSSFQDCARRCDDRSDCNAFTYNQRYSVCFLKYAANHVTNFYAFAITGIRLSPSMLPASASRSSGPSFVLISQADSPGNDYSRIDHFSFEECRSSCAGDDGCNAFTYNHARGVCFLKRAPNQWTNFYAWASTGIKLSRAKKKTALAAPAEPPSEQAQSPKPSDEPQVATSSEHAEAPRPPAAPDELQVATPQEQAQASELQNPPRVADQGDTSTSDPHWRCCQDPSSPVAFSEALWTEASGPIHPLSRWGRMHIVVETSKNAAEAKEEVETEFGSLPLRFEGEPNLPGTPDAYYGGHVRLMVTRLIDKGEYIWIEDGSGENSPSYELILRLGIQRCPITKKQSRSAFCRTFAQFRPSHREIRCAGETMETGGAWPLWRGFFCFEDGPQQFRQLSNIHSNAPRLVEASDVGLVVGNGLVMSWEPPSTCPPHTKHSTLRSCAKLA